MPKDVGAARPSFGFAAAQRSLGTISSSRCQTTRACGHSVDGARSLARILLFFTDEYSKAAYRPPSLEASANNLRGAKAGLPTEAALAAKVGGARRNRTDDLLLAKQALSQLSYGP
jgi:hypothetical protein